MKWLTAKRRALLNVLQRMLEIHMLFALSAAILLAVIWAGTFHVITLEEEAATRKAEDSSYELADTYEAQMGRNLGTIEQTLRTVKYAYELKESAEVMTELKDKALLPPTLLFTVSIADRKGTIIESNRSGESGNVGNEQFFRAHFASDSDIPVVSRPTRSSAAGEWRVSFSRRLNANDGSFNGIVMVTVEPAYLTSGYESSRLGSNGVLGLIASDGVFLARRTGDRVTWGESSDIVIADVDIDRGTLQAQPAVNSWDAVQRYTHVRALHGFPLAVVVGLSEQEQLATFEQNKAAYVWAASGASILLIIVASVLGFLLRQMAVNRRRIRKIQQTYYAASNASLDGFFVMRSCLDAQGRIEDFIIEDSNLRGARMFGLDREALLGKNLSAVYPQSRENGFFKELVRVALTGKIHEEEWETRSPQVNASWLNRQIVPVESGVVAIVRDISERKRAEALRAAQARVLEMVATGTPLDEILQTLFQLTASQLPGMMGSIMLVNDDRTRLLNCSAINMPEAYLQVVNELPIGPRNGSCGTAVYRREPVIVSDIQSDPLWDDYRDAALAHGLRACWSTPILSQQDWVLGALALYYPTVHVPSVMEQQLVEIAAHIAGIAIEKRQAEERIRHMAHHDPLTGLPNRSLLEERVKQAILHAQRYNRRVAVVFIDLDNFKLINDSLGHNAGDELLKTVAERMVASVRTTDTVLRLGGDEFVIVLADQAETTSISAPLHKIHEAVAQPMRLAGNEIQVTCSMGLATYPEDGTDSNTLLMNADAAMYRAKELGRNNYQFYTAEMNSQIQEKLALQEGLRNAIARNELFLVYQPQVDLGSGRVIGTEALIRWQHPKFGIVSPAKFIPVAEETGQIVPIGDWVLRTACMQNKAWQEAGFPPSVVSVNVSARQFKGGKLVELVASALGESGLDPKFLALEITETLIMQNMQQAVATMQALQEMGVKLSIDDFGTGYSSLSALKGFPITRLKLDRSFVRDLPHDDDDKAIAMAVISLGHQLKLKVVAEGVETPEQLAYLRDNGCDEMQGYYFSKPVAPEEMEKLFGRQL